MLVRRGYRELIVRHLHKVRLERKKKGRNIRRGIGRYFWPCWLGGGEGGVVSVLHVLKGGICYSDEAWAVTSLWEEQTTTGQIPLAVGFIPQSTQSGNGHFLAFIPS